MIYFVRVTSVPATYDAATAPNAQIPFQPRRIVISNEDGTLANDAFYSFDSLADAGHVLGGNGFLSRDEVLFQRQPLGVWVKKGSGAVPSSVTIFAEN